MIRFRSAFAALTCSGILLASTVLPVSADVAGLVRGTLTRADHRPLAYVSVTLFGDRTTQTAVTDDDGRFAFAPCRSAATCCARRRPMARRWRRSTSTSVRGTPVSQHAFGAQRLAALRRKARPTRASSSTSVPGARSSRSRSTRAAGTVGSTRPHVPRSTMRPRRRISFCAFALPMRERDLLAADFSSQYSSFQIPINTAFAPSSPYVGAYPHTGL